MAKKEMNMEAFKDLIRKEAIKLNESDNRNSLLENEKKALQEELEGLKNESYIEECGEDPMMEAELEELFGGKFKKAENAYKAKYNMQIQRLMQAYKAMSPEYVDISKQLVQTLKQDAWAIAQQFGLTDGSDFNAFYKTLKSLIEPMDAGTFQRQMAQGGASMRDVASGASAGRSKIMGQNESNEYTLSEFREIIREEAIKLKNKMVLENEKKALQKELNGLNDSES